MPGHALADRGERTAGDLPDETQDPFAHLAEQGRGDPRVRSAARRAAVGDILSSSASTSAWVGAGIAYPLREQRRGPDERAGSAIADGHGPAIGCGDEDPDHPGDDQLQKPGVLTLPVRHRPGGNRYRAGARHELVESVAWKPTQVRPRQRKAHPSIHSRILTEAWKQEGLKRSS
jgi:hypothetical protein